MLVTVRYMILNFGTKVINNERDAYLSYLHWWVFRLAEGKSLLFDSMVFAAHQLYDLLDSDYTLSAELVFNISEQNSIISCSSVTFVSKLS